ncbi:MAG: metallophosphoesterase [Fimbriimonadaceae bacterium]|nr:metallophosphoesterase [Fimbriimonadaceae bacterium]
MSIVRVSNQKLSLWQSAVAEVARKDLAETTNSEPCPLDVFEHPMVKATNDFVTARHEKTERLFTAQDLSDPHTLNTHLSQLCFEIGDAKAEGREEDEKAFSASYWPFSDKDPKFLECAAVYAKYYALHLGKFLYNDWQKEGGGNINYGVVKWQIPNDAKVGIIGDWGTGMADATALVKDMMVNHKPAAIIHVGDIYYSGTPTECMTNFADVFTKVFDEVLGKGKRIPVFTIPGNHDYYALGYGFYPMLAGLNAGMPTAMQPASYFCLRTADNGWQFLAMDTGYEDSNPKNQVDPYYAGPWLQDSEIAWHRDKLDNFGGATILLSHHQVFSANTAINGMYSSESEFPFLNPFLIDVFQPYFKKNVAAWLWGHEHNFVLFKNGIFGLEKGRLVGASAFEEAFDQSPYKVNYPNVPYLDPTKYQLKPNQYGYYSHSYGVIDFAGRKTPTDAVSVSYYEFPSWYDKPPTNPQGTLIYTETYAMPKPAPQPAVTYGVPIQLSVEGGLQYIGPLSSGAQYYPTIGSKPVTLKIVGASGQSGQLTDGSQICIQTTESAAGGYNTLGAWATPALYYYTPGYSKQQWTIHKQDKSADNVIRFGDAVYITNNVYSGQWICPRKDNYLTTTTSGIPTLFVIQKPTVSGAVVEMGAEEAVGTPG